jgi:putative phosphoribosyl transferase
MGTSGSRLRSVTKFKNREQAGEQLASQLLQYQKGQPIVMGIPNGGVPVALPVAQRLNCPLTLVPIRSLPVPWAEETIFGYVTDAGETHINQPLVGQTRLTRAEIYQTAKKRRLALQTDLQTWRVSTPKSLAARTAIIVDDGMHSGWTMFSAIETVKLLGASKIIAAVPVAHFRARRFAGRHCDEVATLLTEDIALFQIGNYYDDFTEVGGDQVGVLLNHAPIAPRPQTAP